MGYLLPKRKEIIYKFKKTYGLKLENGKTLFGREKNIECGEKNEMKNNKYPFSFFSFVFFSRLKNAVNENNKGVTNVFKN